MCLLEYNWDPGGSRTKVLRGKGRQIIFDIEMTSKNISVTFKIFERRGLYAHRRNRNRQCNGHRCRQRRKIRAQPQWNHLGRYRAIPILMGRARKNDF